jgi:hypothetical protein
MAFFERDTRFADHVIAAEMSYVYACFSAMPDSGSRAALLMNESRSDPP